MNASSWLPGIESASGDLALPLWMAGALAAFFFVVCVVALNREGPTRGMRALVASILVAAGALVTLALMQGHGASSAAERSLLVSRIIDLSARAMTQASPLACLVAPAGETVEQSCEKSLFATPETTAAALSFVGMQIALLAQAAEVDAVAEPVVLGLRRVVETDRYGLAAQVFALRHGCVSEQCPAFAVLKDGARVRANLKMQKYDVVMRRYSSGWPAGQAPVMAQSIGPLPAFLNGIVDPASLATNGSSGIEYPSSASIPPISIMNAEPVKTEPAAEPAVPAAKKPPAPAPQAKRVPPIPAPAPTQSAAAAPPSAPLNLQQ